MPTKFEIFSQTYESYFKTTRTSRGITYRYLSVPGTNANLPPLLWLHGFPSSLYDWHYQLDFFHAKGYPLIALDMLGYGGTDKPTDPALYKRSLMARDVLDILDVEGATRVVGIAHDWGSSLLSRIADLYADRFLGFAFLSVGYIGPNPQAPYDLDILLPFLKKLTGKEIFAYWEFFSKPYADKTIADNIESFFDFLYSEDGYSLGNEYWMERGKAEEFVSSGQRTPRAKFLTEEDFAVMREHLIGPGRGLTGPLNWYKSATTGVNSADDKEVVAKLGDKFPVKLSVAQPVLFLGSGKDPIAAPSRMLPPTEQVASDFTGVTLDTSHWILLEEPEKVNAEIEKWLERKVNKT
ncbi:alpha/beta-hydrolase [Exidia glandulosa HHB12029]|uniref:Alpha/beta-hydrolase n=1 Tax=Exidia glandulosa HHB12029 TaxID=1314781 RepID=A0A165ZJC0_EXIGL|nr:alpha/beta-hydrolase [Exidia glandulosa HHB12029]